MYVAVCVRVCLDGYIYRYTHTYIAHTHTHARISGSLLLYTYIEVTDTHVRQSGQAILCGAPWEPLIQPQACTQMAQGPLASMGDQTGRLVRAKNAAYGIGGTVL